MGGELLEGKRIYERDDRNQPGDDQDIRQDDRCAQASHGQERKIKEENLVEVLSTTVRHFFPELNQWIKGLKDLRNQELIIYKRETLIWSVIIMILTKQGARSKIGNQMRGAVFLENLKQLSGQHDLKTAPHGDTAEYLSRRMNPEEMEEKLQVPMIGGLIRGRVLESERLMIRSKDGSGQLDKYYMVAIDGVHTHSFDYEHCPGCLVKEDKKTGRKTWMHCKLQASLVGESGLCLPMASEWIENEKEYKKQDCELKALYRLIPRMRRYYPKLRMCVILDSLYAAAPVMKMLDEARIEWIIVLKEGSMSEVWRWMEKMKEHKGIEKILIETQEKNIEVRKKRSHEERLMRTKPMRQERRVEKTTEYGWINKLEHWDGKRTFNIFKCKEVEDGRENCNYTWMSSKGLNLSEETVKPLSVAGRCRWVIENEGNNVQKNGGYQLEHLYSRDEVSMKIWHVLLNIAHIINQLIERGSLIVVKHLGSIRDIAIRMFEHFRCCVFKKPLDPPRIQIRLRPAVRQGWDTS